MLRDARALGPVLLITGVASLSALAACTAPHSLISARHIGCPVRKLEIRELVTQPEREDWIAICRGQSYACWTREQGRRLIYGCRALAAPNAPDAGVAAVADASAAPPVPAHVSAPDGGAPDAQAP